MECCTEDVQTGHMFAAQQANMREISQSPLYPNYLFGVKVCTVFFLRDNIVGYPTVFIQLFILFVIHLQVTRSFCLFKVVFSGLQKLFSHRFKL